MMNVHLLESADTIIAQSVRGGCKTLLSVPSKLSFSPSWLQCEVKTRSERWAVAWICYQLVFAFTECGQEVVGLISLHFWRPLLLVII